MLYVLDFGILTNDVEKPNIIRYEVCLVEVFVSEYRLERAQFSLDGLQSTFRHAYHSRVWY